MESGNVNNLYKKMFEDHQSIMMLIDSVNGDILEANKAAIRYYGHTKEKLLEMRIQDINIYSESELKEEMKIAEEEDRNYFQFIHRLASNEHREVEVHSYPIEIEEKKVLYSIIHDASNKVEQKKMSESLFLNSPYGVAILDKNKKIININDNFINLFMYTLEEVKGGTIPQIISPDEHESQIDNNIQMIYKGEVFKHEGKRKRKDGELIDVEILGYPVINLGGVIGVYIIYKDITSRITLQQRDNLTGLYNRNFFLKLTNDYIKSCIDSHKFAMIVINLIRFKEINDSLGHAIGDKVLIELTHRLNSLEENKNLVSRFSSDEFAILYKIEDKEHIEHFASKLLREIRDSFIFGNTTVHVNAKIGISMFPENGLDADTLIRNADIAMYKANDLTEDKICFYTIEMSKEMERGFLIANHLVQAVSKNELTIYYQPIFDINQQKNIKGLEALLRWKDRVLGSIPPDIFIPLAEKSGQIIPIGEWVLEEVCKQISLWKLNGYSTVPVAVNISVKQLEQIGFGQIVIQIMRKYNVDSKNIELEITESVSSGDLFTIIKNLKELKNDGIKISMDDFGTGFSSLGQLDLFELDKLKIDKVFIDDLVSVSKKQNLVKSIIAMAKGLDLTVVAEGIETKEQLSYLKEIGCQLGQGYLVSRPLPIEEINLLLDSATKDQDE